eukprot:CAMPEP_0116571706 /NCGR_PEP_ID=MMETSP0397-20121206/17728_1 /TAXON_ID=216820 /ORGANISM="Cyclophora tenuis, Strain ECT3854" /LENGTH=96 /DNA_ID=CAMNT_0004099871 /DNA_START=83 /DNA_END=373 /DNA_ORIENTATION=-
MTSRNDDDDDGLGGGVVSRGILPPIVGLPVGRKVGFGVGVGVAGVRTVGSGVVVVTMGAGVCCGGCGAGVKSCGTGIPGWMVAVERIAPAYQGGQQ